MKFHRRSCLPTKHVLPEKRDHCCNVDYTRVSWEKEQEIVEKCATLVRENVVLKSRPPNTQSFALWAQVWHVPLIVSGFENGGDWRQILKIFFQIHEHFNSLTKNIVR